MKLFYNKIHIKKFKILINVNNSDLFLSTNTLSSVMSQSRILEPELIDDYLVDLLNNLFLDISTDHNWLLSKLELKLPLIIYFFKKEKNLVYIKSIFLNSLLNKYYNKMFKRLKFSTLRLKLFLINRYSSLNYIKSINFNNKKHLKTSYLNFKYIFTFYENFKIVILKTMQYFNSLLSYMHIKNQLIIFRKTFISQLDREFMKQRKINFRRKHKNK